MFLKFFSFYKGFSYKFFNFKKLFDDSLRFRLPWEKVWFFVVFVIDEFQKILESALVLD